MHNLLPPIIHRDIKGENILIDGDGRVKLADFGWSNFFNSEERKTVCGTILYIAPEMLQPRDKRKYDTRVDVWSLGVLI